MILEREISPLVSSYAGNFIVDEGALALAEALKINKTVTVLSMNGVMCISVRFRTWMLI